jgi:hypothetical protein
LKINVTGSLDVGSGGSGERRERTELAECVNGDGQRENAREAKERPHCGDTTVTCCVSLLVTVANAQSGAWPSI